MPGQVQSWFKVRFFTGVFVTLPVVLTAWVFWLFYSSVDDFMAPLYEHLLGRHLPGLGFLTAVLIIFCVGVFATNVVGRRILQWGERVIRYIPLVRRVYPTVKDFVDAFSPNRRSGFREFVIVEHPRDGAYSYGFLTGDVRVEGTKPDALAVGLRADEPPLSGRHRPRAAGRASCRRDSPSRTASASSSRPARRRRPGSRTRATAGSAPPPRDGLKETSTMKFLCIACDQAMRLSGTAGPGRGLAHRHLRLPGLRSPGGHADQSLGDADGAHAGRQGRRRPGRGARAVRGRSGGSRASAGRGARRRGAGSRRAGRWPPRRRARPPRTGRAVPSRR